MSERLLKFVLLGVRVLTDGVYLVSAADLSEQPTLTEFTVEASAFRDWLETEQLPNEASAVDRGKNVFLPEITGASLKLLSLLALPK